MPTINGFTLPPQDFTFAGLDFPKWLWDLPKGSKQKRLKDRKNRFSGPYYGAPKPNSNGISFYLNSDGMPSLRWQWADEIAKSIRHTGWYTDEHGDGDLIRGIVFRLPRGRGFLAGWSMGEGMITSVEYHVYSVDDEVGAAIAADDLAGYAAEREREHREEFEKEFEEEED